MDFSFKDMFRNHVEQVSNGKNTVIYDKFGNPNIMYVLRKYDLKEYDIPDMSGVPAIFKIGGKEVSEIFISKYENGLGDGNVPVSYHGLYSPQGTSFEDINDMVRKKGSGWKLFSSLEATAIKSLILRSNSPYVEYQMDKPLDGVCDPRFLDDRWRIRKSGSTNTGTDRSRYGAMDMNQHLWNITPGLMVDKETKIYSTGVKNGSEIEITNDPSWFFSMENMVELPYYIDTTNGYGTTKTMKDGWKDNYRVDTTQLTPSKERGMMIELGLLGNPNLQNIRLSRYVAWGEYNYLIHGGCYSDYRANEIRTPEMYANGIVDLYTIYIWDPSPTLELQHGFRTTYVPELDKG